jgi:hypothetical protein
MSRTIEISKLVSKRDYNIISKVIKNINNINKIGDEIIKEIKTNKIKIVWFEFALESETLVFYFTGLADRKELKNIGSNRHVIKCTPGIYPESMGLERSVIGSHVFPNSREGRIAVQKAAIKRIDEEIARLKKRRDNLNSALSVVESGGKLAISEEKVNKSG